MASSMILKALLPLRLAAHTSTALPTPLASTNGIDFKIPTILEQVTNKYSL